MTWHDIKSLDKLCLYKTDAYAQCLREQKFKKEKKRKDKQTNKKSEKVGDTYRASKTDCQALISHSQIDGKTLSASSKAE